MPSASKHQAGIDLSYAARVVGGRSRSLDVQSLRSDYLAPHRSPPARKVVATVSPDDRVQRSALPNRCVQRAVRTMRALSAVVARPPFVAPGHFYSPLTTPADVERALAWQNAPGVDLAEKGQLKLAAQLRPMLDEPFEGPRYSAGPDNTMFGAADAAIYRAMLLHLRPARVMEIGSGYTTALALDTADAHLSNLGIHCVEPYPERLLALLQPADRDRIVLERRPVQDVPLSEFAKLAHGDILFIDSTHVAKAGSDVVWLFLHILPRLRRGVVVHVHDVFWPFEYPADWLQDRRDWTENYLLHAFLVGNSQWRIEFFSSWMWDQHREFVPQRLATESPGSIWLCRVA
jgi:Methyltransferase domain